MEEAMKHDKIRVFLDANRLAQEAVDDLRAARRKRSRYAWRFVGRANGPLTARQVRVDVMVRLCTIGRQPSGGWVVRLSRDRLSHESLFSKGQDLRRRFPAPFLYARAFQTIVRMIEQYVPTLDIAFARSAFYDRCHKANVDSRADIETLVAEGEKLGHTADYASVSLADIEYWTGVLFPDGADRAKG
jgi:hypothetical protein